MPARVIVISSPGAVIRYFEEAALSNASSTGQTDMEQLAALAKKYDIEFVSPPPEQGAGT